MSRERRHYRAIDRNQFAHSTNLTIFMFWQTGENLKNLGEVLGVHFANDGGTILQNANLSNTSSPAKLSGFSRVVSIIFI